MSTRYFSVKNLLPSIYIIGDCVQPSNRYKNWSVKTSKAKRLIIDFISQFNLDDFLGDHRSRT